MPMIGTSLWIVALGFAGSIASAAAAATLLVPGVRRHVLPLPQKKHLADYVPLDALLVRADAGGDERQAVIRCDDGSMIAVVELTGRDVSFLTDDEQRGLFHLIKQLLDGMEVARLRHVVIRRPVAAPPESQLRCQLADEIARRWNAHAAHGSRNIVALVFEMQGASALARLNEAVDRALVLLRSFGPRRLSDRGQDSAGGTLTLAGFFGLLVSPITQPNPAAAGTGLRHAITVDEVEFEAPDLQPGWIRFWQGETCKFASVLSVRDFGSEMRTRLAEDLLAIDAEFVLIQAMAPVGKAAATARLYAKSTADLSAYVRPTIAGQYATMLNMVGADDEEAGTLIEHALVLIVYGASAEAMLAARRNVESALIRNGARPKRERTLAAACWFNQIPTAAIWPRLSDLSSWNVANLLSFHTPPAGAERSVLDRIADAEGRWSDGPASGAIAYVPTAQGSVFAAQFHDRADSNAGHSITVADTNAGKTTWASFFALMSSRHRNLVTYLFDRLRGMYAFTSCMQQSYVGFGGDLLPGMIQGGLNPLHAIDSERGFAAVRRWLEQVTGCRDADSLDEISNALAIARMIPQGERSLAALHPLLFSEHGDVRRAIEKWIDPRRYGGLVNAAEEAIGLDDAWLTAFDMTEIGADDTLAPAILTYLVQRCLWHMQDTGKRAHFLMDEMPALIRIAQMPETIGMLLREIRKAGGMVSLLCQSPRDLTGPFGSLVRTQCQTQYLYVNPNASAEDWHAAGLDLNERELAFVQGRSRLNQQVRRGVLMRRPAQRTSVVLDVDLSCLGPALLKVFSSNADDVRFLAELRERWGPDAAIERYVGAF